LTEAGSESPHLDEKERKQAEKRAPLGPVVIHEIVREQGEIELKRSFSGLAWSGLAAGLSIGFSFVAQAYLYAALPDEKWRPVIASFGYSLGFLIVVLGRQQLFTETTLTAVLPVFVHPDARTIFRTVRLWNVVLAANVAGTWIFAAALAYGHPLPAQAEPALAELAAQSIGHGFGDTLLRAIFAGWLIAIMVWLLPSARDARFWVVLFLTWIVSLGHFSHIIAGSTEAAYAVMIGKAGAYGYVVGFLIPTLIGNTIGGVSLVALLNHAPVKGELDGKAQTP
jgi:formate/nitrite transporter FocA (FNT family)